MKEFVFKILDKNGLHARPAGAISAKAKEFSSKITVSTDEREAR